MEKTELEEIKEAYLQQIYILRNKLSNIPFWQLGEISRYAEVQLLLKIVIRQYNFLLQQNGERDGRGV